MPYLFPQEASQRHCITAMAAHARQADEHDRKQYDVGNQCEDGAVSDARQVGGHTIFVAECSMEL